MALTSADVNNVSFSIDRKGYNVDEVDVFLERIAAELDDQAHRIEQLLAELEDAKRASAKAAEPVKAEIVGGGATSADIAERDARIRELEAQVADHKAEDSAIAQALIIAQRSADEILANANGAAETTRQDAQNEAQRILDKANEEKQRVLEQIKKLEDDREAARDRFTDMLSDFIGSSQDILSDLQAGKAGAARGSHIISSSRTLTPPVSSGADAYGYAGESTAAAYTTPTVSSAAVVTPATPKATNVEKDFSGFGDTDDGFEFDDVD